MRNIAFILLISLHAVSCSAVPVSDSKPVSHEKWDQLLKKHVNDKGMVNYKGFIADSTALNNYLDILSANHPNNKNWSKDEALAYWINAYNAFTIQLIIRNYPVESIKDIAGGIPFVNTPWDVKFIQIEDETYDLNNIEHSIIRKEFNEPKIHFALVCAAISCPKLRNEAYTAEKLDAQLEDQTRSFFNNPKKNQIGKDKIVVSKLLKWYWGDFSDVAEDRVSYVNRYASTKANSDAEVDFMEYNWALNEQ